MYKTVKIISTFVFMGLFIIACKSNIEKNSTYIDQCTPLIIEFLSDPDSFYSQNHNYEYFDIENKEYLKKYFDKSEFKIVDSKIIEFSFPEKGAKHFLYHIITIKNPKNDKLFYFSVTNSSGNWKLDYCGQLNPDEFMHSHR